MAIGPMGGTHRNPNLMMRLNNIVIVFILSIDIITVALIRFIGDGGLGGIRQRE